MPSSTPVSPGPLARPTGPKLRDSCHSCASSKLKCSKEKPRCSRCAKRGNVCEYFATKRAGRKQASRATHGATNGSKQAQPSRAATMASSSPSSAAAQSGGPITARPHLNPLKIAPEDGDHADIWSGMLPTPDSMLPTIPEKVGGGGSDYILGSGICFDSLGTLNMDYNTLSADDFSYLDELMSGVTHDNTPQMPIEGNAGESFIISPGDAIVPRTPSVPPVPLPFPGPDHSSLPARGKQFSGSSPKPPDPALQCEVQHGTSSCIAHALNLLGRLFPAAPDDCMFHLSVGGQNGQQALEDNDGIQAPLPTIDQVISNNEEIVKILKRMLECHCAQDGYLLHIISLIVFKVLGWYVAVTREKTPPPPTGPHVNETSRNSGNGASRQISESVVAATTAAMNCGTRIYPEVILRTPAVIGAYRLDGEGRSRMAAQLVLSQLPRVQQLVKLLSNRVRERASSETSPSSRLSPLPFSMSLLEQLEIDLRKYLRNMAAEIVDMLRRE